MRPLARAISIAGHPVATMLVFAIAAGAPRGAGGRAALVALAVILPISTLVLLRRRSGAWETVDASRPQERPALHAVAMIASAAVLAALLLRRDVAAAREVAAVLAVFAAAALARRWVKTSLHVAFAALGATALLRLGSPVGWALVVATPAIAWSRLRLDRHTPIEIAVGAVLGAAAGSLPAMW